METRTIPELLQVLLDNEDYFYSGLCILNKELCDLEIISLHEFYKINKFLKSNLPELKYHSLSSKIYRFSFPYSEWPPRKEWLEKQIESFKNIES